MQVRFNDPNQEEGEQSYVARPAKFRRQQQPHQERPRAWYSDKTLHIFLFSRYLSSDPAVWEKCFHSLFFVLDKRFNGGKNVRVYYVESESKDFISQLFVDKYRDVFTFCPLKLSPEEEETPFKFHEKDADIINDFINCRNDPDRLSFVVSFVSDNPDENPPSLEASKHLNSLCKGKLFFRTKSPSQNFRFDADFDPIAFPPFYVNAPLNHSGETSLPRKREYGEISRPDSYYHHDHLQNHHRSDPSLSVLEKLTDEELVSIGRGDLIAKRHKAPISNTEVTYTPDGKLFEIITTTRFFY